MNEFDVKLKEIEVIKDSEIIEIVNIENLYGINVEKFVEFQRNDLKLKLCWDKVVLIEIVCIILFVFYWENGILK